MLILEFMNKWIKVLVPMLVCAVAVAGCGRREMARLDDIESYVQARPDSALAQLRALDPHSLRSLRARARHSLLHAMALDKCYIDVTSDSIIAPAARYYRRHGTTDDKFKAFYYLGRTKANAGSFSEASKTFTEALGLSKRINDKRYLGLLYQHLANVNNRTGNYSEALAYTQKAYDTFKEGGYSDQMAFSLHRLAEEYNNNGQWAESARAYEQLIDTGIPSEIGRDVLCGYALLFTTSPSKDYAKAASVYSKCISEYGSLMESNDWGSYAYSLTRLGKKEAADSVFSILSALDLSGKNGVYYQWKANADSFNGDYKSAWTNLKKATAYSNQLVAESLEQSAVKAQRDYFESEVKLSQARSKMRMLTAVIILLFALSGLFVRIRRMEEEISRLLQIQDDLGKRLKSDALLYEKDLSAKGHALSNKKYENKMLSGKLRDLRFQLDKERLSRFRDIGYNEYLLWMNEQSRFSPAEVMSKLRRNMSLVLSPESDHETLMKRIDGELDGLASSLKEDLGLKDPVDIQFLCYWILDLKTDMISELLKVNASKVYRKGIV